jgi:hypothetical protein
MGCEEVSVYNREDPASLELNPLLFILFQKPACIGLKEDLCVVSMSPAVENIFSHGTEVRY